MEPSGRVLRSAITFLATGLYVFGVSCVARREPAEDMTRGEVAYLAYCAMCHGDHGDGDGPVVTGIVEQGGARPAPLNDGERYSVLGRDEVQRVILQGGLHTGRSGFMPEWVERVDSTLVPDITDHVMTLPSRRPPAPRATIDGFLAAPPGSAEDGRRLYVHYCSVCHGSEGRGDGFHADTLLARSGVRPSDLTDTAHFESKADQELYVTIALGGGHGGKSTFMPAWRVSLTPAERKSLVSYVRAISGTQPRP